jgi:YVTN family beta-propeller protein
MIREESGPSQSLRRPVLYPLGAPVVDLGTGDLLVLDARSRRERRRIHLGRGAAGILIPGDGGRAYVAVSPDDAVAVVDLGTLCVVGRIPTGRGPDGMAWATR